MLPTFYLQLLLVWSCGGVLLLPNISGHSDPN